jgi:hypothetical protein
MLLRLLCHGNQPHASVSFCCQHTYSNPFQALSSSLSPSLPPPHFPTGWPHVVATQIDSFVIGGNFLATTHLPTLPPIHIHIHGFGCLQRPYILTPLFTPPPLLEFSSFSGWPHVVAAPTDSFVVGSNFLTTTHLPTHVAIQQWKAA